MNKDKNKLHPAYNDNMHFAKNIVIWNMYEMLGNYFA